MTRRRRLGIGLIALALGMAAVLVAGVIRNGARAGLVGGGLGTTSVLLIGISLTLPERRR